MPKVFKQHFLKEKEAKQIFEEFATKYGINFQQLAKTKASVQEVKTEEITIYAINEKPALTRQNNQLYPTLLFNEILSKLPVIVVDMGAVPHICNGADLMAPGIAHIEEEFKKDDLIVIMDEKHRKPLSIGLALVDSQTLSTKKQ